MLLKRIIRYKERGLEFNRTKIQEATEIRRALVACRVCGLYTTRGACKLKYRDEIEVEDLMCGFDLFWNLNAHTQVSHAYVAEEESDV